MNSVLDSPSTIPCGKRSSFRARDAEHAYVSLSQSKERTSLIWRYPLLSFHRAGTLIALTKVGLRRGVAEITTFPQYLIWEGKEVLAASAAQTQPTIAVDAARANEQQAKVEELRWQRVMRLPCELAVDLPLPNFRVSDFLALRPGSVVVTSWGLAVDVPLRVNGILIGWGELEGAGNRLGVRLMELA